jgi:nucleotide-binding universal stress UspA family protein
VTAAAETAAIRRILVALDATAASLDALEASAELAAKLDAELAGLFVEDENLLRLAGLPFARAYSAEAADLARLDIASMEQALRAQAARARQALEQVAARHHVGWSFRVARGRTVEALTAAARECDILGLGKSSRVPMGRARLGSTARATLTTVSCAILLLHRGGSLGRRVVALFTGSPRTIDVAAALAAHLRLDLDVLAVGGDAAETDRLKQAAVEACNTRGVRAEVRARVAAGVSEVAQGIDAGGAGLIVAAPAGRLAEPDAMQEFAESLTSPLLVVR